MGFYILKCDNDCHVLVHISHVSFSKYYDLVVKIVVYYNPVNYVCVCKNMRSAAGAVCQGEGDLGIGELAFAR